jgi:hypothetical protein
MSEPTGQALTLQELPELRRKTEAVSDFLKGQLAGHLETLRPILSPERILGKYAGGKVDVTGAERALAELRQSYVPFAGKPYDLPETLDLNWLGSPSLAACWNCTRGNTFTRYKARTFG